MDGAHSRPLSAGLFGCRRETAWVVVFSLAINLLTLTISLYTMLVYDRVLASRSLDTLAYLTLIAVLAVLAMAGLEYVRAQIMTRVGAWLERRFTAELFGRAVEAELQHQTYRLEALNDLSTVRAFVSGPGMQTLLDMPWVPVYLLVITLIHPLPGLIALVSALILAGLAYATELATREATRRANQASMETMRNADTLVRNAEIIDSMGMANAVLARWGGRMAEVIGMRETVSDRGAALSALARTLRQGIQIGMMALGAALVLDQQLTGGAMMASSIILGRALAPIEQAIGTWRQLVSARQAQRRLDAWMERPRLRAGGMPLPPPTGELVAENLTYLLPDSRQAIIRGVSFGLAAGQSLGMIGPSASGKTTLLRLMVGTLKPTNGTLRLDGADVFAWPRDNLGRHIGYLPQDVELFPATVRENIARLGEASPEEVVQAAQLAHCHDMILALPDGYDTMLGEGAHNLSAGQRQRVALARALLGRPRLVLLDEPNANLDFEGEQALLAALDGVRAYGGTVVVVSHRTNFVHRMDRLMVLRGGLIELYGPRDAVMKKLTEQSVAVVRPPTPAALEKAI